MQSKMAEMAVCSATTPNAYRRRQPYTFCPINTAWGYDNRTVGLRVIEGSDSAVRVEKRDGSADCNPYLLLAAEMKAGLDGIEQKMQPTAVCDGNAYEAEDATPIPSDLASAVALANESSFLKDLMGEHLFGILISQAERELDFMSQQVTPVETQRYLRNL